MDEPKKQKPQHIISKVLDDGGLIETVFRKEEGITRLLHWQDGKLSESESIEIPGDQRLMPYSPRNNLLTHEVILLASNIEEYESEALLVAEVRDFVHRHVDVTDDFEAMASYYVLFTWVYDAFSEVPYLRVRGDYGSGKSRFLLTLGSLCYKPIFASGASTVSPLFRIMDALGGTLVIDEADFRASDEKAEITKILNNGNARGFPVLRSESNIKGEFSPRAFTIFGPKLVATRRAFDDPALESRCITEEMGQRPLRKGIPINLPRSFHAEAQALRNKLLLFRFRNFGKLGEIDESEAKLGEPRVSQILAPLLSIVRDREVRQSLRRVAREHSRDLKFDRSLKVEAQVLEVIKKLQEEKVHLTLQAIAKRFEKRFGKEYANWITPRWIGGMLRKRLFLSPSKSHGVFVIPLSEYPKLNCLFEKYGLLSSGSLGALGTTPEGGRTEPPTLKE